MAWKTQKNKRSLLESDLQSNQCNMLEHIIHYSLAVCIAICFYLNSETFWAEEFSHNASENVDQSEGRDTLTCTINNGSREQHTHTTNTHCTLERKTHLHSLFLWYAQTTTGWYHSMHGALMMHFLIRKWLEWTWEIVKHGTADPFDPYRSGLMAAGGC